MLEMRTTVDIPADLLRQAKVEAVLTGRKLKDLIEEGLRLVLAKHRPAEAPQEPAKPQPSVHDLLKEWCGDIEDAPADLSTNPKYFDDFGR